MILLLSVRLLDSRFHGLAANGDRPNWPPSCFRLFQAIVAGNARGVSLSAQVVEALKWLETLPPPVVIVPQSKEGRVTVTYVLNNSEGRSRTQKFLRPTLLNCDRLIEFGWQYDPSESMAQNHARVLLDAVRHIRSFGWGIDLAIGHGVMQERLPEPSVSRFHFVPREQPDAPGIEIRVPRVGSMDSLSECFRQYLGRFESSESTLLESGGPLYQPWPYTAGIARPNAVFKLIDEKEEPARYPHAKLIHIAGMVRHAAIQAMSKAPPPWIDNPDWVSRVVRGKRDETVGDDHKQFSYVPLPSIGHAHADAMVRNVMIVAPFGLERELEYLAERLDGVALEPEDQAEACETHSPPLLPERITLQKFTPPPGKFIAEHYLGTAAVWETVTPVILDGCNRKSKTDSLESIARATEKLVCKALARAGITTPCEFTWQSLPFFKNTLSAHKYDREGKRTGYFRPTYLTGRSAVHLRLTFTCPVPGPITLGAGRHCGFGLLATAPDGQRDS